MINNVTWSEHGACFYCVYGGLGLMSILYFYTKWTKNSGKFGGWFASMRLLSNPESILEEDQVQNRVHGYANLFSGSRSNVGKISTEESIEQRKSEYKLMVDSFYDLVTDFYEYGWGQSFHFAPRFKGEDFVASIARVEHFLALKLQLHSSSPRPHVLDMGCGIGGPMRSIARFTGAKIDGITLNAYQVKMGNRYNAEHGLKEQCHVVQGDYMHMPWANDTFDAAYAIESTCHAPDRVGAFAEAFRVLKPGGLYAGLEWMMLAAYDPDNQEHVRLKEGIEVGNGLPTLVTPEKLVAALEQAGFIMVEHHNLLAGHLNEHEIPWYDTLKGQMTWKGFRMTRIGRMCTHALVNVLEFFKIAPVGSVNVSKMLNQTADDLVAAGHMSLFTPNYFFLARKPITSSSSSEQQQQQQQ